MFARLVSGWRRFLHWLGNFFWHLRDIYHELKPCRFAVIVAVIGAIIFLKVEQGREVLRALGELSGPTGVTSDWRLPLFWFGLLLWSLASWYSARLLLCFDFAETHVWHPQRTGKWARLHQWLSQHVPRILGVAPFGIVGISFLSTRGTYETDAPKALLYSALASFFAGALVYCFFIRRRRWLQKKEQDSAGLRKGDEQKENWARPTYTESSQLGRDTWFALAAMTAMSLMLLLMFVCNAVFFAGAFGTGAVLMFAAASWVFWGSALVYFSSWKHIPIIILLVAWVLFCSLFNDNHDVRVVSREPFARPTLEEALDAWQKQISTKYPDRPLHSLFIVATEGGGIRAAYWSATVLGSLQDKDNSFANHVFAISGVSGGSLGAAVFDALVADGLQKDFARQGQMILGQDFLSPAIAAMLYPDLLQRFLPFRVRFLDRGRWLERGWEKAWKNTTQNDDFARSFFDLWRDKSRYVPALFLNGTSVETGNRIIASNILIDSEFLEAADATEKLYPSDRREERRLPGIDMPLSTTAHLSARFTYVSPAGRFAPDGSHVVDGGYFENSGAATALDILRQVTDIIGKDPARFGAVVPQIVMISNDPLGVASGSRRLAMTEESLKSLPASAAKEASKRKPGTFLEDALAPAWALLSAREARGDYAQRAIGRAETQFCDRIASELKIEAPGKNCQFFFSLAPATVPLPLGWMLSNRAAQAMQNEMSDTGLSKRTELKTWNQVVMNQIVNSLHCRSR